jgi:UDP-N-acetylmuramyl tripeptide synthase
VTDNAKIAKLVANGAIAVQWEEDVQPEEHAEPVAGAPERGRRSRAQQAGNA